MTFHKFISDDTVEYFDGERFISSTPKSCLYCGGLWYRTEVNYQFTSEFELPPVLSARGEQPTTCSREADRIHEPKPKDARISNTPPECNCWLCDS